jgi:hypothetical protein
VSTIGGDASAPASEPRTGAVLWAEALQALANIVAHDFRNALNAVSVNLEVVRSRSVRGAEASAIAPFATTAATHFETSAAAGEALLAFARPEPAPVDVAALVIRLSRLMAVGSQAKLHVVDRSAGRAKTSAPGDIVRAAVARSVLGALSAGDAVACEIAADDGIFLRVTGASHVPPRLESEIVTAAATHGIRIAPGEQSLELRFPEVD